MKPNHIFKIILSIAVLLGGFLGGSQWGRRGERSPLSSDLPSGDPSKGTESAPTLASDSNSVLSHLTLEKIQSGARDEASKPESDRNQIDLELYFYEWSQREPMSTLAFSLENRRIDWMLEGTRLAARNNFARTYLLFNQNGLEGELRELMEDEAYRGFAQADPKSAMGTIEGMKDEARRHRLIAMILGEWIHQDADQAFQWLEEQDPSDFLNQTYEQLMEEYITQSPKAAAARILAMKNDGKKSLYAKQAGASLAKDNPQEALEWAENLEGESKQLALEGIFSEWGYSGNELEALNYLKSLPANSDMEQLFSTLIETISRGNPERLKELLPSLDEVQQQIAASSLGETFSEYDPPKAKAWIDSLPEGPVKDAAIAAAVKMSDPLDLEQSLQTAQRISDASLREATVQEVFSEWMQQDPQKALQALNQTEALSPDQKVKIAEHLKSLPLVYSSALSTETNYIVPSD